MSLSGLYTEVFRTLYRVFRAVNGAGEKHEYVAAATLSVCWLMNIVAASLYAKHLLGLSVLPNYQNWVIMMILLTIFVLHYALLIRGSRIGAVLARPEPAHRGWIGVATFAYVAGSALLFLEAL